MRAAKLDDGGKAAMNAQAQINLKAAHLTRVRYGVRHGNSPLTALNCGGHRIRSRQKSSCFRSAL